jgi:hypothetical protein
MVSYQALGFGVIAHILCLVYLASLFFSNLSTSLQSIIFNVHRATEYYLEELGDEECDVTVWRSEH